MLNQLCSPVMGWKSQICSDRPDFFAQPSLLVSSRSTRSVFGNSILKSIFSRSFFKNVEILRHFSILMDFAHLPRWRRIWRTFLEPSAEPETTKKKLQKDFLDLPPIFFCAHNSQNTWRTVPKRVASKRADFGRSNPKRADFASRPLSNNPTPDCSTF